MHVCRYPLISTRRCNVCGEWIYKGKKFNSRKETVANEDYLGIKIFRYVPREAASQQPSTCRYINVFRHHTDNAHPLFSSLRTLFSPSFLTFHRFYMRCPRCSAEFTIKTDPKNADYVAEINCSRNFEPWRENEKLVEEGKT